MMDQDMASSVSRGDKAKSRKVSKEGTTKKSLPVRRRGHQTTSHQRLQPLRPLQPVITKKPEEQEKEVEDSIGTTETKYKELQHQQLQILNYNPSGARPDPFSSLNQPRSRETDFLLHHWTTSFRHTRIPLSPRPDWLQTSICNPTLLYATIASSTAHILLMRKATKFSQTFINQKLEAIEAINRELVIPDLVPSDTIIMAVTAMVIIECLAGTPASVSIHKKGLNLLVQKRGGIENLGFGGITKKTVSWADTCTAMTLRQKPHFSPVLNSTAGETLWPDLLQTPALKSLHHRLHPLTSSPLLSSAIVHIYARLLQLTTFITTFQPSAQHSMDDYLLSDKFDHLERQILSVLHSYLLGQASNPAILIAFLHAAYIFTYQMLREVPPGAAVCTTVASRISSGLELVDLLPLLPHVPDLVVWVLVVGRMGASPKGSVTVSFMERTSEVENWLGITIPEALSGMGCFDLAQRAVATVESRGMEIPAFGEVVGLEDLI